MILVIFFIIVLILGVGYQGFRVWFQRQIKNGRTDRIKFS